MLVLLAAILVCFAGIAYGVIQLSFPDIHKKILDWGHGRQWLQRRYDPYSRAARQTGLPWIVIFGGCLIWLIVRELRYYGIIHH